MFTDQTFYGKIIIRKNKKFKLMKTKLILIAILSLSILSIAKSQTARDIAEKASDAINFKSMEMVSTLKIYDNKNNMRTRQVATATKKIANTTKTLIKFLSPADVKGTSLLIYDYENESDAMWIYIPALRKTRRIVSSEKGKSFMGSEFSNADMSKPNLDDFVYKNLGTETINGVTCWKIESKCKNEDIEDENGFSRKVAYIDKNSYLTYRVEYYDFDDELLKIMTFSDYRKQSNGGYFAYKMEMQNVQSGRKSVMEVDKFQLGSNLSEADFAANALGK